MDGRLQVQATVAPPGSGVNDRSHDGPSQSPAIRMTFFDEIPSNTPGSPDSFRPGGYRPAQRFGVDRGEGGQRINTVDPGYHRASRL